MLKMLMEIKDNNNHSYSNHQGNANQNHNETSPHTCQMASSENLQTTNAAEGVETREPSCTVGGNVN